MNFEWDGEIEYEGAITLGIEDCSCLSLYLMWDEIHSLHGICEEVMSSPSWQKMRHRYEAENGNEDWPKDHRRHLDELEQIGTSLIIRSGADD